ncbi:50S ribosomal protein L6 [Tuberibacillus sp. Marseille-P3662]|uniref:50S ribosomal protein L6 n=1 Tax=Tuberibacillus sp. Marseille-P3662 TaxID=1965358 RepID=UPI000A1CE0BB|nr:50S ribosomal protein L6 [Tuberibacillus sp. Marseille-P3662]
MSRVGYRHIEVPNDVTLNIDGTDVTVKGPKGELSFTFHPDMQIIQEENIVRVERPSDAKKYRMLHGTTTSIINNMVDGVTKGFEKHLELQGVGYRAVKQGEKLVLNVGYSHPVEFEPEEGIDIDVEKNTKVIVKGVSKERVGAVAANIRAVRPPEPYKGKGIRYGNERVRQKEGKSGK